MLSHSLRIVFRLFWFGRVVVCQQEQSILTELAKKGDFGRTKRAAVVGLVTSFWGYFFRWLLLLARTLRRGRGTVDRRRGKKRKGRGTLLSFFNWKKPRWRKNYRIQADFCDRKLDLQKTRFDELIFLQNSLTHSRTHLRSKRTAHKMLFLVIFTKDTFSIASIRAENPANPRQKMHFFPTFRCSRTKINTRSRLSGRKVRLFALFLTHTFRPKVYFYNKNTSAPPPRQLRKEEKQETVLLLSPSRSDRLT